MRKPTIWTILAGLVALVVAGIAVASQPGAETDDATASFSATEVKRLKTRTCQGADGTYEITHAVLEGEVTTADPAVLGGKLRLHLKSVYNDTENLGWVTGKAHIHNETADPDTRARASFKAVNVGGNLEGILVGGAGAPHWKLLATFSAEVRGLIEPSAEMVELTLGTSVQNCGQEVDWSYFPFGTTMISLVVELPDGRSVQVASIGREGAVGGARPGEAGLPLGGELLALAQGRDRGVGHRDRAHHARADLAPDVEQRGAHHVGAGLGIAPGERVHLALDGLAEGPVPRRVELDLVDAVAVAIVRAQDRLVALGGVELDARAHARAHCDLLDIFALGAGRARTDDGVDERLEVGLEVRLGEARLADAGVDDAGLVGTVLHLTCFCVLDRTWRHP